MSDLPFVSAPRDVHVAPLPPGHVEGRDCPCAPIVSTKLGEATILVHRLEAAARIEAWEAMAP